MLQRKMWKKGFFTDTDGTRMSPSYREAWYQTATELLQGMESPRGLAWDINLGFYSFKIFLFYLCQTTQTQAL